MIFSLLTLCLFLPGCLSPGVECRRGDLPSLGPGEPLLVLPAVDLFCTESRILDDGLTEQLEQFLSEHLNTSPIIIDTLQMIQSTSYGNTYANDYRDLSMLKKLAGAHRITILLIHHLRKERAADVFNRISGTTAISGVVDSGFTLVEEQHGSSRARLSCIGRDIEYRELELRRNADNVWEVTRDSYQQLELLGGRIVLLLSALLDAQPEFIGTPTDLANKIDPDGSKGITPKRVSRQILQSVDALWKAGIATAIRRSSGKRLIERTVPIVPIFPGSGKSTLSTLPLWRTSAVWRCEGSVWGPAEEGEMWAEVHRKRTGGLVKHVWDQTHGPAGGRRPYNTGFRPSNRNRLMM